MSIVFINPYRYDPDAEDYINRVIAADVAAGSTNGLEVGVQDAINAFALGCKADGNWPAIKASCILAGARTLAGALVPLVGTAPTNYNFVAADYNRKTGLKGDGSTKYLVSNRNNTADPQDSRHLAVYQSTPMVTDVRVLIGTTNVTGRSTLLRLFGNTTARISANDGPVITGAGVAGFLGGARSSSTSVAIRNGGITTTGSFSSEVPASAPLGVFAAGNGSTPSDPRLAFYSIGEFVNLALLDARVSTLMSDLAAAIP